MLKEECSVALQFDDLVIAPHQTFGSLLFAICLKSKQDGVEYDDELDEAVTDIS